MSEHPIYRHMNKIDGNIYLGSLNALAELPTNFTHIISVLGTRPDLPRHLIGRKHLYIKARDDIDQDLLLKFGECFDFISTALAENHQSKILIHCRAGVSRSATIVMMYLIRTYRLNYDGAHEYLRSLRPIININRGFRDQLRQYAHLVETFNATGDLNGTVLEKILGGGKGQQRPIRRARSR